MVAAVQEGESFILCACRWTVDSGRRLTAPAMHSTCMAQYVIAIGLKGCGIPAPKSHFPVKWNPEPCI